MVAKNLRGRPFVVLAMSEQEYEEPEQAQRWSEYIDGCFDDLRKGSILAFGVVEAEVPGVDLEKAFLRVSVQGQARP